MALDRRARGNNDSEQREGGTYSEGGGLRFVIVFIFVIIVDGTWYREREREGEVSNASNRDGGANLTPKGDGED